MSSMTYELINTVTTNTFASFTSAEEANAALEELRATDDKFAASLVVVAFDDEGLAVDERGTEPADVSAEGVL